MIVLILKTCGTDALLQGVSCQVGKSDFKKSSSTFFRAHGVLLKNFKLDLMLGSFIKH
jgi:hypothetical protein